MRFSPVTTPAGTRPSSPISFFYLKLESLSRLNHLENYILHISNHQSRTNYIDRGVTFIKLLLDHFHLISTQLLNALSEVDPGIFSVGSEFLFNPEELVVLGESLGPAGRPSLDLPGSETHHQVGDEAVLGLPRPVGHHRTPALALRHVVGLDGLGHAPDLVDLIILIS